MEMKRKKGFACGNDKRTWEKLYEKNQEEGLSDREVKILEGICKRYRD